MRELKTKPNIPDGWKLKTLSDLVLIKKGEQLNRLAMNDLGEYPAMNGGIYPSGYTDKWNVSENTITISEGGNSCGYVNFNKEKFWCGGHCYAIISISENIDKVFLYQILKGNQEKIMRLRVGSGLPNIQKKSLLEFRLLIPPFSEQKKIAEILSTIDEDIRKTDETIFTTEKLKSGLMQKLFAKGIGHTKFKETKIGQIPEEWEVQRLERFIKSLDAGVSVNSTDIQKDSGEIGILKTSAVTFGVFDPNQHKVVVSEEVERVAVPVKADRLIVSRMNTRDLVGANAYTARSFPDLFLPDRLWQVEPNDEKDISMQWLSYVFNFQWKNGVFANLATGTSASMKNLSKGSIFNMELAFPKIKEQKRIAEILSAVDEKVLINKKLKEKLTLLKKGLMQDLLSGKVRTKEYEL